MQKWKLIVSIFGYDVKLLILVSIGLATIQAKISCLLEKVEKGVIDKT